MTPGHGNRTRDLRLSTPLLQPSDNAAKADSVVGILQPIDNYRIIVREKGNKYAMTNLAQTPLDPKPFQDDIRVESLMESVKYKQCPHCGKRFRFKRHFGKHLEGHKHHDCKLCDTLLSSRQENARHMLERHCIVVASKSLFKCEYCPKKFVKRATLHNHYKKHLEGQDVCLVCGEFVESAEELKAHQNNHEQDKEWQCEQCDQWFARRQQYLIHMKVS
uniref:(California timema) hypothetical protein n=1 Tax=Timema californicum TaxID=61474 RepID=A0A7R9PBG2_TIMCA|nr:unnamed protein product [Timema californicum]